MYVINFDPTTKVPDITESDIRNKIVILKLQNCLLPFSAIAVKYELCFEWRGGYYDANVGFEDFGNPCGSSLLDLLIKTFEYYINNRSEYIPAFYVCNNWQEVIEVLQK